MLYMDKKSEPKMVGSAYLVTKKFFQPYKQRWQTLMATMYILRKSSVVGRLFICGRTPKKGAPCR